MLFNPEVAPVPLAQDLPEQWMLKKDFTFLNHGSFGAMPRAVYQEQNRWRERIEAEPIEIIGRRRTELLNETKAMVGRRFGMAADDFGLVTNATDGVNAVLRSLDLLPGDELVTTDHVYHAVRQAMRHTTRACGASLREIAIDLPVASAEQVVNAVLDGLTDRSRLLVLDHVTSPTAMVFPIQPIIDGCRSRGIDVLVDGAHVPGMVPLDVPALGANYYTGNLHKWVCAPKGSAFLWVEPSRQNRVHPNVISHHLDEGFQKEFDWQGTRDLSAWLTLPFAIAFLENLGWERMQQHNHQLAVWAERMLCQKLNVQSIYPANDQSLIGTMATVRLPAAYDLLDGQALGELQQRIYVQHQLELPLLRFKEQNYLRVSCQVYNNASDYERVPATLRTK